MAGGMEMMVTALVKAMGFDPVQFSQGISGFIGSVQTSMAEFDTRLTRLETMVAEIHAATVKHAASVPVLVQITEERANDAAD